MRKAKAVCLSPHKYRPARFLIAAAILLASFSTAHCLTSNVFLGRDITGHERELSVYDLLVLSPRTLDESAALHEIRRLNPDIRLYLIFDLRSGNYGGVNEVSMAFSRGIPAEWKAVSTRGDTLSTWPETWVNNITEFCPVVKGRTCADYCVDFVEKDLLPVMGLFDGLFLDECGESLLWIDGTFDGDFDLNGDRRADDPDSVVAWVRRGWRNILHQLRERHPDLSIIGNGNNHFYGELNGRMFEEFPNSSYGNLVGGLSQLETWRMNQGEDAVCILNAHAEEGDEKGRRASWALAQFSDQYLSFDGGAWDHDELNWSELNDFPLGRSEHRFDLGGENLLVGDFENGQKNLQVFPGCSVADIHSGEALEGEGSLALKIHQDDWTPLFSMDLRPFSGRQSVLIAYRYRVLEAPENGIMLYQCFRAHGGDGSEKAGGRSRRVFQGESGFYLAEADRQLLDMDGYYFYMASEGAGRIVLDDIRVIKRNSAYVQRTFSGGMLVHSLSKTGIELNLGSRWKATDDYRFAGSFRERDGGSWILNSGETVVFIDQGETEADDDAPGDGGSDGDIRPDEEENTAIPAESTLTSFGAAYPNPFNPKVSIPFSLSEAGIVRAEIYDASGRRVRTLASEAFPAGDHRLQWTGENDRGGRVASGVYFLSLAAAGRTSCQKLVFAG